MKTQDKFFNEREKLLIRLPTNQAVIPAHNSLLQEHTKERILIADSFKAIKDGKADLREKTMNWINRAEETYIGKQSTHKEQIERLLEIAKIAKIKAEDITIDELLNHQSDNPLIWSCVSASTLDNSNVATSTNFATEPIVSVDEIIDNIDKGNTNQMDMLRQMKKDLGSDINGIHKGRHDHSAELVCLPKSLFTVRTFKCHG